jgi:hypothetical protein
VHLKSNALHIAFFSSSSSLRGLLLRTSVCNRPRNTNLNGVRCGKRGGHSTTTEKLS